VFFLFWSLNAARSKERTVDNEGRPLAGRDIYLPYAGWGKLFPTAS
jgi:hypothetical protein